MLTNFISSEQHLVKGLKSVLDNQELKIYEKMVMIIFKVYQAEYGSVFPDYDTIAAAGSMSKRKAQYVVKDLVDRNEIEKKPRFKEVVGCPVKQTSNLYTVIESSSAVNEMNSTVPINVKDTPEFDIYHAEHAFSAQDASDINFPCAQYAPYNAGFINQDSLDLYTSTDLKEEEDTPNTREHMSELSKYAQYADVVKKMIKFQGTGTICYLQEEFLSCCKYFNLPPRLISKLYPHIESSIQKHHFDSIFRSLEKFTEYLAKNKIHNPISWFKATFSNEDLKVRTEIELMKTGQVS
ncbi:hypothetical protein [Paenibacillus gallinarum]|uniref:Helix-turn-helix domain-containing protein n=1 Tax=Paenibacillus gallinarum TaxID=2762232 RepID=A0ABR8T399_9BACL|nr:hypothetical protein [Paenibacillus gallinarum]MBD7970261.1 hypothetical protein [Paenibacillus gallinarum]